MTNLTLDHPLVQKIATLRRRARILLTLQGLGIMLASGTGAFLLFTLADYLLHFAAWFRFTLAISGLLAWLWVAFRYWLRPLATPLTDQFLASRVEMVQKPLADELISALAFIRQGLPQKNMLAAQAVDEVSSLASNLSFEKALNYRLIFRSLGLGSLLACILVGAAFLLPALSSIAVARWTDPFGSHSWPQNTQVAFVWANDQIPTVHPIGEPLTVRAVVRKGFSENLRVFLYTSLDGQRPVRELMNYQEAQSDKSKGLYVFEKRLEPVGDSQLSLQLSAGDDTEQNPVLIRLAARPEVTTLKAQISPPPYAIPVDTATTSPSTSTAPTTTGLRNFDLFSEIGRAVDGSTIRLLIHASKPLQTRNGQSVIRLLDAAHDTEIPLPRATCTLQDPTTALLIFPAEKSLEFRVQLRDADGFENRVASIVRLDVIPDALPTIALTEPRRPMEVIPEAIIPIELQASDDLGLSEILLQADNFDAKPGTAPRYHHPLTWSTLAVDPATLNVTGTARLSWNLAELQLKPGDRLSYFGLARDNYQIPQAQFGPAAPKDPFELSTPNAQVRHRYVKSAPLSLLISTRDRIEELTRKDLQDLRDQLRTLIDQQSLTNQQTRAIQKAATEAGRITSQQQQQLAELASQQAAQAQRALGLQTRAEQIKQSLGINQMADSDLGKLAQATAADMKDVSQNNMPKAASELSKAQEAAAARQDEKTTAQQSAQAADRAAQQQELALSTMGKALDRLGAAGDLEAHRSKINDLLERQKDLEKQLRTQAAKTLGTPREQLSPADRAALERMAKDQDQLAAETAKLTAAMEKSAEQLTKNDPAASESLNRAVQAGRNNNVVGNQSSAAQATENNQMSNAAGGMTNARKGLEEMKDELDQQNRRQLEQLARQIQELLDSLMRIRTQQEALNLETVQAGATAARELLEPLGNRQSRLQGNVLAETQRAEALKDGRPVALDLRDAADAMGNSTTALLKSQQPQALPPEKAALAALDKAIAKLQKQKKELEDKLKDEDLATFRRQYEQIKADQAQIQTATNKIVTQLKGKEPERSDLSTLGQLATAQVKLQDAVKKLSTHKELSKYEVLVWINDQILDNMTDSKTHLSKAQLDSTLTQAQQSSLDRLQDIIDALKEEQKKQSEFSSGGGGGGGGGGGKPPLIPPAAQLKLLKSQQVIINRNTGDLQKQIDQSATESAKDPLRQQVKKLGDQQDKIKDLATKVIEQLKQ